MIRDIHDVWETSKAGFFKPKKPRKKREEEHRIKFMNAIRRIIPAVVPLRHEDTRTAGIPDISLTLGHPHSVVSEVVWLECKAKTLVQFLKQAEKPAGSGKKWGLQRDILRRLGGFYIIFDRDTIYVVEPTDLSVVNRITYDPNQPSREPYEALALIVKGFFL